MEDVNAISDLVGVELLHIRVPHRALYTSSDRKTNQRASMQVVGGVLQGHEFKALKFGRFMGFQSPFISQGKLNVLEMKYPAVFR